VHATFLKLKYIEAAPKKFWKICVTLSLRKYFCFRVFRKLIPLNVSQGLRPLFRNLFIINSFNRNYFSDINFSAINI
jgi:hypothetical protein